MKNTPHYLLFFWFAMVFLVTSCNNDDEAAPPIPEDELALLDDEALVKVLNDHYFGLAGKITKYDAIDGNEDDTKPNLHTFATQLTNGVWIVPNPSVSPTGPTVQLNDSLLVHFNCYSFRSEKDSEGNGTYSTYSAPNLRFTTTVGDAIPIWDPFYIQAPMYDIENDIASYYEIEGIKNALTQFKATQKNIGDAYHFQGVILVPSRLAYARDKHYTNPITSTTIANLSNALNDHNFIFNFEVFQALPRP